MKVLLHGLNFAPEEIGIGKYSGEMAFALAAAGHEVCVVTTPPYYPQWRVADGYRAVAYRRERVNKRLLIVRCPLWVPRIVSGFKRIIHLASFGLSSVPVVLWKAIAFRPDVVMTVEPAAVCMPTSWLAARLCGAKAWLHVQDFEVDAAFELGILKSAFTKKFVSWIEAFLMRRFDRVSSISPNMLLKLVEKGVVEERIRAFPNWVDCELIRPLDQDIGALRRQFGIPENKMVCLYSGNLGAKQGLEIILHAADELSTRSDIHFVICGTGASADSLEQPTGLLKNVQRLPLQPFSVFNQFMNCGDVHLLPQRSGAADLVMPSKLTGMLATGRPIVACASPDTQIADVVSGRGIVVQPEDLSGFVQAISSLADDPFRRQCLGANAREYAVKHLGKVAILDQFMLDLQDLIDCTKKSPRTF